MSSSTITLDELMVSLKEPLPEISGYLEIMWDVEDSSIPYLDKIFEADTEYIEERRQLTSEINTRIVSALARKKTSDGLQLDNVESNIDNLTMDEIIAKLKCKCKNFKHKFGRKAAKKMKSNLGASSVSDKFGRKADKKMKSDLGSSFSDKFGRNADKKMKSDLGSSSISDKFGRKAAKSLKSDLGSSSSFSDYSMGSSIESDDISDILQRKSPEPVEMIYSNVGEIRVDHPKIGINCKQFLDVKDYAISFVDDILQEAKSKVNPFGLSMETIFYGENAESIQTRPSKLESTEIKLASEIPTWVSYLLIEDFTPQAGRQLILETIQNSWNLKRIWSFCIDFTNEYSDTCADFYLYEAKWSSPTRSYPIPQVTASVYFTIEVSRVKPKDCPVKVTYHFETERYKFSLADDIQQEIFLDNIMKSKIGFFKSLRY